LFLSLQSDGSVGNKQWSLSIIKALKEPSHLRDWIGRTKTPPKTTIKPAFIKTFGFLFAVKKNVRWHRSDLDDFVGRRRGNRKEQMEFISKGDMCIDYC